MSNLINKTTAQIKAEKIDALQSELQSHVESILSLIYAALTKYGTLYAAISALNPATTVPAPDLNMFKPQLDGTVLFVAVPEEAPEP